MFLGDLELYKIILWYILLPITVVFLVVIFFYSSKQSNVIFIYKVTSILFFIYFMYSLCLSFDQLALLRKYFNVNHIKDLILLWILMPMISFLMFIYTWFRYRTIKSKGARNAKKDSSR